MRVALLVGLLLLLSGCVSNGANLAEIITALGKDPATVCATVMTNGVTASFARTNIVNGDVTCDKLVVKSPGATTVPVTIQPVSK